MPRFVLLPLVLFTSLFGADTFANDGVVVPAYQRFRGEQLDAVDAGRLLISELNCQSCHGSFGGEVLPPRQAPILTKIGERTNRDYLQKFIHDPQSLKPGTAMPGISGVKTDASTAEAIGAFLTQGTSWRPAGVSRGAVRRGEALFHSVGCAACHGDQRDVAAIEAIRKGLAPPPEEEEENDPPAKKTPAPSGYATPAFAMPLGKLDDKYTLSSLITFLQDPHAVRPSGRMPSLNLNPEEARDIASYLLKDVKVKANIHFDYYEGNWDMVPDFSQLTPKDSGETTDFSVAVSARQDSFGLRFSGSLQIPADAEYRFHLSSDDGSKLLIDGAVVVENDGVHPPGFRSGTANLKAGSHAVVIEFFEAHGGEELTVDIEGPNLPRQPMAALVTLTSEAVSPDEPATPAASPELISKGRDAFSKLGCAACHQFGDGDQRIVSFSKAPPFPDMKTSGGCLAETPAANVPVFAFSAQQRSDIAAALKAAHEPQPQTVDAKNEIRQVMMTMNCYACHARDSIGGASEAMNHVFTGSIPEMGDEGRIPPALDGAGDKLNEDWLKKILNDGAKDRPYMATRMPKFGNAPATVLVPRLVATDLKTTVAPVEFTEPEHRVKAEARLMVGDQALSCIKCHTFDKYAAIGLQSLDMTTMTRRLRRDWFHRYLLDPQKYRPGTRMPSAWPNNRSVVPQILGGDPAVQIEAIWDYLLDGPNAKVPSGLLREAIELTATDRPILYRNFLSGLSPRGIAVGFPEKAHFAWDAEHMTPRIIWHGAFIDASLHWIGRGQGNQTPLGDHVMTLPPGPPVATLISLDSPWPDKNPRESGFHFNGYNLDPHGIPTFKYHWNDVAITDSITPFAASPDNGLRRTVTITSPTRLENAYLRIAASPQIEQADNAFVTDGMTMKFEGGEPLVRTINNQRELLVPVTVDANGKATVTYTIVW